MPPARGAVLGGRPGAQLRLLSARKLQALQGITPAGGENPPGGRADGELPTGGLRGLGNERIHTGQPLCRGRVTRRRQRHDLLRQLKP